MVVAKVPAIPVEEPGVNELAEPAVRVGHMEGRLPGDVVHPVIANAMPPMAAIANLRRIWIASLV